MKIDHSQFKIFPCCYETSLYALIGELKKYKAIGYYCGEKVLIKEFYSLDAARNWSIKNMETYQVSKDLFVYSPVCNSFNLCLGGGEILENWRHLISGGFEKIYP